MLKNDRKVGADPRSLRRPAPAAEDDRWLLVAGAMGLAAAAFTACSGQTVNDGSGGSSSSDSSSSTSTQVSASSSTSSASSSTSSSGSAPQCAISTSTATNTAAVVAAATALYGKLTAAQQTTIQLDDTLANVEQWSNLPTSAIPRNGVRIGDMSTDAQTAAVALATAATSSTGFTLFSELRAADEWLVTNGMAPTDSYGEGLYYFAFLGAPSTTSAWMLQIAGHHLAYNFTYNGPCTSATPLFDGVEPTTWTDTSNVMHAPLESQRAASVAVIGAVASNADALLSGTFTDIVNGPTNQNEKGDTRYPAGLTYPTGTTGRGVLVGSLSTADQALVKTAIEAWVDNAGDATAAVLLAEYESDTALAETYVGYSGAKDLTTQDSYFRIDGPRVWIEVTIQGGIIYPSRVHYHTIWRDKASDYGGEFADSDAGATTSSTTSTGTASGGPPGGDGGPPFGDGGFPGMGMGGQPGTGGAPGTGGGDAG